MITAIRPRIRCQHCGGYQVLPESETGVSCLQCGWYPNPPALKLVSDNSLLLSYYVRKPNIDTIARNQQIVSLLQQGEKKTTICERFGLSPKTVTKIGRLEN